MFARVHYKNWNKRYDEWVELDRIMRVYDDKGDMVKSRVPDETDEKKAVSTRRSINLRNKSKSAADDEGDDDDENDEDGVDGETEEEDEDEPLRPSAPVSYHFVSHHRCFNSTCSMWFLLELDKPSL